MTKSRSRRSSPQLIPPHGLPRRRDAWPIDEEPREEPLVALGEPEIGLDQSDFYRWRRNKSDPPPAPFAALPRRR